MITGLLPTPPSWTHQKWVQDGDVLLAQWFYKLVGWTWLKSKNGVYTVQEVKSTTCITCS